jgi:phosphoglycerate dehydrogenase-like enzyme
MKAIYIADKYLFNLVMTELAQTELRGLLDELNLSEYETLRKESPEKISQRLHEYDILIGGWGAIPLPMDYTPIKPQFYQSITGTFVGKVDPVHAERGLRLANWGDSISHTIAESALTMILASLKLLGMHYENSHQKKIWKSENAPHSRSLFNRKVGLFGFGMIAQQLAKLLAPFDVQLFSYDPYVPDEVFKQFKVNRVASLEELFSQMDIISVHAAKTKETNHLINKKILKMMKDDAVLVNTARGNVLDEKALAEEHAAGRLFSALDVYEVEPLPKESELRNHWRCILIPHQGGPSLDQYFRMMDRTIENIRRYVKGQPILMEIDANKLRIMT